MKISCVISIFNEEIWMIDRAIRSMINQTYGLYEIIVVIDNPERKELEKYLTNCYESLIPIRVIVNPNNYGLAKSLNIAIDLADGDYICRMDSDDEALPTRIEKSLELMRKQKIAFVSTRVKVVDENGNPFSGLSRDYACSSEGVRKLSKYVSCTVHPTWIFAKKIWKELHGYREVLFSAQDYDFNLRALKAGYDMATVSEPLLNYTYRASSISGQNKTRQVFLTMIIQNNVYRKEEFDELLIKEIKEEKNKEYLHFKYFYEKYREKEKNNVVMSLIEGFCKDRYFRQLMRNTVMWKICNKIYK